MKCKMNNQQGFALVFALTVLLLASVGGTALLFMTQKDHTEATDYAQMRSASQAATAALKACEGQFLTDPNTALAILAKYGTNNAYKWMLGTDANANSEQKITLGAGANALKYSARIVNYDNLSQIVVIEATGYTSSGGKKKALATYQLSGFGMSDLPVNMPFGLFMNGQLQNCSDPVCIRGGVYLNAQGPGGTNQHFNQGGKINGTFKTSISTNFLDMTNPITITGNTFMQCGIQLQQVLRVNGKAAFTGTYMNWTSQMDLFDDAYFISTANLPNANRVFGQAGKTVLFKSPIAADRFTGFSTETQTALTTANLETYLGMTSAAELPFGLAIPAWGAGVVQNIPQTGDSISATALENFWLAHQTAGTLFKNEWLVLQLTANTRTSGLGGTFTRKAIWITGNFQFNAQSKFFNCSNGSNTLIIANGSGSVTNMGVGDNYNFRGLIYVNSTNTGPLNYQFGASSILYGAIHHASNTSFNLNNGACDSLRLYFSESLAQSALQEIANTGIILAPGLATVPDRTPVVVDLKIRPRLLSVQL